MFRSFTAHLVVQEVRDYEVVCALDRETVRDVDGNEIRAGELDPGGLSGAPAFLVGALAYPLVALVKEDIRFLDESGVGILRLATLSHVDLPGNDATERAV